MMRMMLPVLTLALTLACGGAPEPNEAPTADGKEVQLRTFHVLVNAEGYKPDTIEAEPGEKVRLLFSRPDEANCGEDLVFPESGRKVSLPVGEDTEVIVTAPEAGTLAFTCGMGMYQGALVVGG